MLYLFFYNPWQYISCFACNLTFFQHLSHQFVKNTQLGNLPLSQPVLLVYVRDKTQPKIASVTMSIGIAEADSSHSKSTSVMKAADQALYKAKKRGRNCMVSRLLKELNTMDLFFRSLLAAFQIQPVLSSKIIKHPDRQII